MAKMSVYVVTLGCSKNEVDSELMLSILDKENFEVAVDISNASIIIVNTCGFIESAKEESIETIWEMTKYKKYGNCRYILLAGCLAQRYSKELMEEIEDIDGIIGTGNIRNLNNILENLNNQKKQVKIEDINNAYLENVNRINFSSSAYVRISEGCDNHCTYCIIPKIRGKHRSRKMEDIINEVEYLASNGVKEIILIAQNTSDYGIDLYGEYSLYKLLDKLNEIKDIKWIRIHYLYPDHFSDELINSIKNNAKVLKYVDIPLQHINNSILKKMNRRTNKDDIILLIKKLRKEISNIVIRTTFIVGFPGEGDAQFKELYDFINNVKFDRLGVFTYSKEEDTIAYNMPNQLYEGTKEKRRNMIMELQKKISENIMASKIGNTYEVLIEECIDENTYVGRTYMDSPEIDGVVYVNSKTKLNTGDFVNVKISDFLEYDLIGELVHEFTK
ncbi:30S ribosomal protein S12 methylthiotransferase RimO [Paratissierella segnis]|uniref:Ribosomal protein uS12 methylthiotransferase RimO n=1 Tax=Paratissierella segnis TaxID=2763679 RepID=A0A926EV00_9FIRM|nr:30S ribosomal protein S12 methylthiotransferase RimO [Paratissierella segnis]MBC8588773.1 30S ribosomal protein S12 methylthiotransferase RimO [Paratissierella segnis]